MYLKLKRIIIRGILYAYVVQRHGKVTHISPGSGTYPKVDEEMIARTPIVDTRSSLRLNQDSLHRVYV